ncbi:MAG TPA: ATP-dependent helicase [Jatrophihabitans sp.]|jgi:superfamily I DNA/RNA helicase|uniref:UvrD-helicase domain-containing protein n=1 Tax=Jatrophihabitans sp. TaxID=1932789 RepID=UPI002F0B336B
MTSPQLPSPTFNFVTKAGWVPLDVDKIEPAVDQAIRDPGNVAVIAGPGAGKTEFLAQRAAYLLQTGLCRPPQRILAISFKRDSAANLTRRVNARLPDFGGRLVSMTFDSFTKGLIGRFRPALPTAWTLRSDYTISFPKPRAVSDFITWHGQNAPADLQSQIYALDSDKFLTDIVGTWRLPSDTQTPPHTADAYMAWRWWKENYRDADPQLLEFTMINRLAELLVRTSPSIRRALQITYPFVFVDEFQDTTAAQLDFLHAVFGDSATITVVGDRKQRIMGFAGALPNAVDQYMAQFGATRYDPQWNFRSSAALVQLQQIIAGRLDSDVVEPVSKAPVEEGHVAASIWSYGNDSTEATHIAHWIATDIASSNRTAADFAVLGRQKVSDWEQRLSQELARYGLQLRNDDRKYGHFSLQDILKHDLTRYVFGTLQMAAQSRGLGEVWLEILAVFGRIRGIDDNDAELHLSNELSDFVRELRIWQSQNAPATADAADVVVRALGPAVSDVDAFVRSQHRGEDNATQLLQSIAARLAEALRGAVTWSDALEAAEARDAVSLLTVHRSKGLEYHTVFFVGMDDDRWWAHARDRDESTSTFFVGLSRAAQRIIFTTTGADWRRSGIADLYAMLAEAGAQETHWA